MLDSLSLSEESAVGVAPRAGSSDSIIAENCVWACRHQSGWQFGETGVIDTIVSYLDNLGCFKDEDRWVVEFGAGDGSPDLPLTVAPIVGRKGWKSLLIDSAEDKAGMLSRRFLSAQVFAMKVAITGDNSIDELMAVAGVNADPAVMVVDVDSIDYHIVREMRSRPHVLCVETLDILSPTHTWTPVIPTVEECGKFVGDRFGTQIQANAAAFDVLMQERGYKLVFRSRVNSIYVRCDTAELLAKRCVTVGSQNIVGHERAMDPEKLDYPDGSVDELYAPKVLDRLSPEKVPAVLAEWKRVLKPRGLLRISVSDMRKVLGGFKTEDPAIDHGHLQTLLYGSGAKAGFVRESLMQRLYAAGFGGIGDFTAFVADESGDINSLNLISFKRAFPKLENPKVCLVLSQPRLAFTGHETALLKLSQKLKFETQDSSSAFWDEGTTLATMEAIAKYDPDYLLYSDYDSKMEPEEVLLLLETINNNPDIAAIGSIQPSRHHDQPLVLDPNLDYTGDITRVKFQHFGLTIVRREVFDEIPQPWFWSVPGQTANGEWNWASWHRSDADITFWRHLDLLGFQVYQHNKVNIGHMVLCIKYVRDKGKGVQLVPIENYNRHGKPKDAIFNADMYRPAKPKEPESGQKEAPEEATP